MTDSLILAAHGTSGCGNPNQPMFDLADRIAQQGHFDVVTPAFLNGQPRLANILEEISSGNVVIVPVMTSDGYYVAKLPHTLQKNQNVGDHDCFITRVLGEHESIPFQVSGRISSAMADYQMKVAETTVVVIGHGTGRNQNSCRTTLALTENLSSLHPGLAIETAFLDQAPSVSQVAETITTPNTLIIPFLIGRGPHATVDIPAAFGLPIGLDVDFPRVDRSSGCCLCDLPVGLYPGMADVCLELAREQLTLGLPVELTAPAPLVKGHSQ